MNLIVLPKTGALSSLTAYRGLGRVAGDVVVEFLLGVHDDGRTGRGSRVTAAGADNAVRRHQAEVMPSPARRVVRRAGTIGSLRIGECAGAENGAPAAPGGAASIVVVGLVLDWVQ